LFSVWVCTNRASESDKGATGAPGETEGAVTVGAGAGAVMAGGDCAKAGATRIDAADTATGNENLIATSSKLLAK
jgi:hypothetical protein